MGLWSAELCGCFQRSERAVVEDVYRAHVGLVEHVLKAGFWLKSRHIPIRGVSDPEERADLLQEVFARAFSETARRRFDATLDFRTYLLAITRNLLIDHYRRFKVRPLVHISRLDEVCADTAGADQLPWQSSELVAVVERYVAALNAPLREIYDARYVLGRSQRETAFSLGLSRQTVRTLEQRVKAGLRSALRRAGHAERAVRNALEGRLLLDGSKAAS